MKITEAQRTKKGLQAIEDISSEAQSVDPKRSWKQSHEAVCRIYEIVHSIRNKQCRKNHPNWIQRIDDEIAKENR